VRVLSLLGLVAWALLVGLQLGVIPGARNAWGVNLWQYLPSWALAGAAAFGLSLCSTRVRDRLLAAGERWPRVGVGDVRRSVGAGLLLLSLLWLVRDRQLLGDANILLWQAGSGMRFLFPDLGATFLFWCVVSTARGLGLEHAGVVAAVQLVVCVVGVAGIFAVVRTARALVPEAGGLVAGLLLSGGLLRIFAGHVEVYAFVLAAAFAYLASALALLEGRGGWPAPCIALGVGLWLHPSSFALLPSAVVLLRAAGLAWPAVIRGLAVAALPGLVMLLPMALAADRATLDHALEVVDQVLGQGHDPAAPHRWVRGFGGTPSVGTDYVLLSAGHLKYLANSLHLLMPWALGALAFGAVRRGAALLDAPVDRFLAAACAPLVLYALVLRPIWGPFDWDLFALTASLLAVWAARGLATCLSQGTLRHTLLLLAGLAFLFVGLPLLAIGFAPIEPAGPLVPEAFDVDMLVPGTPTFERLAPWL